MATHAWSADELVALAPPRVQVAGNELTIFTDAPSCITSMAEDIRAAQHRVWGEVYTILDDAAGRTIADALIDRAHAGCDVRLHYDAIGSLTTPAGFFRQMQEAGVHVHAYHSLWEAFWNFNWLRILNRRNHRKLIIVDDRVAYFGGMNLGFQGLPSESPPLAASTGWRDVHVRLSGPQQREIADSIDRSWRMVHGERVSRRPRAYRQGILETREEAIQFFDSGPGLRHSRASRIFTRLLRMARRRLTFSMAYFVPVGHVLRELLRAHRRGVFVQVVIPADGDVPMVQRATHFLYRKLLRRRFHLYERQLNMLHSKVLIVDGRWTVLGSANLDARSLRINREFMAVIHSRKLAKVMSETVQREIECSRRVRPTEYRQTRCWQRLLDRLAWWLRWWL
jgi:cardiolipin synthase